MRRHEQLSLAQPWIAHPHARELEAISRILDAEGGMAERVGQDLVRGVNNPHRCTWRGEMSFQSYVWSGVLKANLLTLARHTLA
jgi:hypothetical protein